MAQLVGPGAIGPAGPTSQVWTTPFPHKPGDKSRDKFGNEFVFVDYRGSVSPGILVSINSAYQSSPLLGTDKSMPVGIAMCSATGTEHGGWVQIYGTHIAVQAVTSSGVDTTAVSDLTSAFVLQTQTSVNSPTGALSLVGITAAASSGSSTLANEIVGMWLANEDVSNHQQYNSDAGGVDSFDTTYSSDVSGGCSFVTATTGTSGVSMHTGVTVAVRLNYPVVLGQIRAVQISGTSTSDA